MSRLNQVEAGDWQTLASNYHSGWGEENLEFDLDERVWSRPADLEAARRVLVARSTYAAAAEGRAVANDPILTLADWSYDGERLKAQFVLSDELTHKAYRALEEGSDSEMLDGTRLEVNVFVVSHDNLVIIREQDANKRCFSLSHVARDGDIKGGEVDIVGCAVRGAREEMGVGLKRGQFVFTSMGLEQKRGRCALLGLAYSGMEWSEMWLGDERWEQELVRAIPFRVEEVLAAMQVGDWDYAVKMGLLEALVYQYGQDMVWEEMQKHLKARAE